MGWVFLVLAGLCEMIGVAMISKFHRERSAASVVYMLGGFALSFYLLALAMQTIAMGTAYAIWTGIGASGGAVLGMALYGESKSRKRIFFIALILGSAVGLKLIS